MRSGLGKWSIGLIVAGIAVTFVVSSLLTDRGPGQGSGGQSAGTVNGDSIPKQEFDRAYEARKQMFSQMGGGQFSEEQLQMFGIKEGVFNELVRKRLLIQEAKIRGMTPSDEAVMEEVKKEKYFQKDGKFDVVTYREVLKANNYSPAGFERMIRDELTQRLWQDYFRSRAKVSEEEIRREFRIQNEKRNIKFVALNQDHAKKLVKVTDQEVKDYFKDSAQVEAAKKIFEERKTRGDIPNKDATFDQVKNDIAKEEIAKNKTADAKAKLAELAKQIAATLGPDKGSDGKVSAILKPLALEVKESGLVPETQAYLAGAGEAKEVLKAAFSNSLSKAKVFETPTATVVAVVKETKAPDPAKFEKEKDQVRIQIMGAREAELMDSLIKELEKKASIKPNKALFPEGLRKKS